MPLSLCRSVALLARAAGLSNLSAQLATVLQVRDRIVGGIHDRGGAPLDAARFPMPRLQPRRGFTVNPALVYALTRVESNFDSRAVSGAGAHGLMQVMPVTARYMQDQAAPGHPTAPVSASRLRNPAVNLELGQDYVLYLAGQDGVRGDLIRLLASYNAGPNALSSWNMDASAGDPLLYIESLPNTETRNFVHRALAYLWIYAGRMGQPAPSLDTLAQGGWPRFAAEQKLARVIPAAAYWCADGLATGRGMHPGRHHHSQRADRRRLGPQEDEQVGEDPERSASRQCAAQRRQREDDCRHRAHQRRIGGAAAQVDQDADGGRAVGQHDHAAVAREREEHERFAAADVEADALFSGSTLIDRGAQPVAEHALPVDQGDRHWRQAARRTGRGRRSSAA